MELSKLDNEAKDLALKEVKNMLQRSSQLEKIDQFITRTNRKKISDESLLKNALQNQLSGVRVGLSKLKQSTNDVQEIDERMKNIQQLLVTVPQISENLEPVREENTRHSQYVTAIENLKHIFTVQASVEKAMQWIEEDKLLMVHQCLSDLENSRDDLLFELHKLTKQNTHDKITLKCYFDKVETISNALQEKLKMIFKRTLNTVRKEPTVIVTALRIVEREEKADQFALQQHKQTGFLPPGRPKGWRAKALQVLNETVEERIEGGVIQKRDEKLWLVKDLEMMRQLILEDLRVIQSLCVPCFPPDYQILNQYVKMYHRAVSRFIEDLIQRGIEGNEYVSLLSWVLNTYTGPELMAHPDLQIDLELVKDLVKPEMLRSLEEKYLKTMERNYTEWMEKTLETEKQDWQMNVLPDANDQYYHTSSPVIIFQMIDQHLQVANTIKQELTFRALVLSIQQVTIYGQNYRNGIVEFKERHFKDRSQVPYFTQHVITMVNNCQQMNDLAHHMKNVYWPKNRTEHYEDFEKLLKTFQDLRDESASFLLEEAFLDLEAPFNELFTVKWVQSSVPVDTICVTLEDYFQDYNHLRSINFEYVIREAQQLVAKRYIKAMMSKRLSKPRADCEQIAKKIHQEISQIRKFFDKIAPNLSKTDTPFDVIINLAQLLVCDTELLILDLHSVLSNYPSLTQDHLVRIFYIRSDIKINEIKETIQDAFISRKSTLSHDKQDKIFKEIVFNDKLW